MDDNEGRTSGRSFEESKENCKERTKKKVNVEILIQLDIGRRSPLSCNKAMRGLENAVEGGRGEKRNFVRKENTSEVLMEGVVGTRKLKRKRERWRYK